MGNKAAEGDFEKTDEDEGRETKFIKISEVKEEEVKESIDNYEKTIAPKIGKDVDKLTNTLNKYPPQERLMALEDVISFLVSQVKCPNTFLMGMIYRILNKVNKADGEVFFKGEESIGNEDIRRRYIG